MPSLAARSEALVLAPPVTVARPSVALALLASIHGFSLDSNFAATIAPTEPTTEPTNASVGSAANGFGACTLCDCPAFKGTGSRCQTRHCHHKFSVHGDVTDPEPTNAPVATGFGVCNCGCPTFVGNGSTCQNCGHGFSQHSMFAAATEVTK
jgi:hypothetical protein